MRFSLIGLGTVALISVLGLFTGSARATELCFMAPGDTPVYSRELWEHEMNEAAYIKTQEAGANVNLRSGPGTSYDITGSALDGAEIQIIGYAMEQGCVHHWFRISYQGGVFWLRGDLAEAVYGRGLFDH